jgi:hypothetical protein
MQVQPTDRASDGAGGRSVALSDDPRGIYLALVFVVGFLPAGEPHATRGRVSPGASLAFRAYSHRRRPL